MAIWKVGGGEDRRETDSCVVGTVRQPEQGIPEKSKRTSIVRSVLAVLRTTGSNPESSASLSKTFEARSSSPSATGWAQGVATHEGEVEYEGVPVVNGLVLVVLLLVKDAARPVQFGYLRRQSTEHEELTELGIPEL